MAKLSDNEKKLLRMLRAKESDKKIRAELGMDQTQLIKTGEALRAKIGVAPGGSLRDAATKALERDEETRNRERAGDKPARSPKDQLGDSSTGDTKALIDAGHSEYQVENAAAMREGLKEAGWKVGPVEVQHNGEVGFTVEQPAQPPSKKHPNGLPAQTQVRSFSTEKGMGVTKAEDIKESPSQKDDPVTAAEAKVHKTTPGSKEETEAKAEFQKAKEKAEEPDTSDDANKEKKWKEWKEKARAERDAKKSDAKKSDAPKKKLSKVEAAAVKVQRATAKVERQRAKIAKMEGRTGDAATHEKKAEVADKNADEIERDELGRFA